LLAREGPIRIERIAAGTNFRKQRDAAAGVDAVFSELCATPPDLVAASANGTFIDAAEQTAIGKHSPKATVYAVKGSLGESVGASSLWQTICGARALITQRVPGCTQPGSLQTTVVSTCGLNQQVAGIRLRLSNRFSPGTSDV
jgi:3-oxoacyl-(acyl-carrier-protein) synthase